MTWMDRSGNSFDQATLMIRLLEEAQDHGSDTITNIKYVVGEIELTAAQAEDYFKLDGDEDAVNQILARGGIYADVSDSSGTVTAVNMIHCWVSVTINGNTYEFDPSFKDYDYQYGLYEYQLTGAMDYDSSDFVNDATVDCDSGNYWVNGFDTSSIQSDLQDFTENLVDYIETNKPHSNIRDIISGYTIAPVDESAMPPSSLPYTVESRDDDFGIDSVPELYRTTLRVQHPGIDQTFFSSDIYGRRLTVQYNGSNQPQLLLDGTVEDTGTTTSSGTAYDLTLTVDHPYDDSDFDAAVTVKLTSGGFYNIFTGFGDTNKKILEKHHKLLEQERFDDATDQSEGVMGESYALVGLTWLAQTSQMRQMAASLEHSDYVVAHHHSIGVAGEYTGPFMKLVSGVLSITDTEDSDNPEDMFLTITGHSSGYEQVVIGQLQDCDAVSTNRLLEMANDHGSYDKIYIAESSGEWSSVQSNLNSYSQAEKDHITAYINDSYSVYMPEYGDLSDADWTGTGFLARKLNSTCLYASYIVADDYAGGVSTS
ncbi:MAG: hypothetical protein GY832_25140, partial [Chloroflexi bacterium]|nr:hypothetical protein [Chloroflexota bacterium]